MFDPESRAARKQATVERLLRAGYTAAQLADIAMAKPEAFLQHVSEQFPDSIVLAQALKAEGQENCEVLDKFSNLMTAVAAYERRTAAERDAARPSHARRP